MQTGRESRSQYNNTELKKFLDLDINKMWFKRRKASGSAGPTYYIDHYIQKEKVHHTFVYNNIEDRDFDFNLIYEK